jgi:hypothetical protein
VPDLCEPEWEPDVELLEDFDAEPPPTLRQVTEQWWPTWDEHTRYFDKDQGTRVTSTRIGTNLDQQVSEQRPFASFEDFATLDENSQAPAGVGGSAQVGFSTLRDSMLLSDADRAAIARSYAMRNSGINYANQTMAGEIQRNSAALLQFMRDSKLAKTRKGKKESLIDMAAKQQGVQSTTSPQEPEEQPRQRLPQQKVEKPPNTCSCCGGNLRPGFKFCVFCGTSAARAGY